MGQPKSTGNYPLLKYFSASALLLTIVVTIVISLFFRQQSINSIMDYGEQSNLVLTQALSNTIWPHIKPNADALSMLEKEALKKNEHINKLHDLIRGHVKNTPVLKIKVFNLSGKTIYSTDPSQLGDQKPDNYSGSISAKTGQIISVLKHRDSFNGINGVVANREVISSYLPIYDADAAGKGIAGVFEVYLDVTEQMNKMEKQQYMSLTFIISLMMTLYVILYLIVKRADRIILFQSIDLKNTMAKFEQKTRELREFEKHSS